MSILHFGNEKDLSRNVPILAISSFIQGLGLSIYFVIQQPLILLFTENPIILGLVLTISAIGFNLLMIPGGAAADRFGKKKMIIIGDVGSILGAFLLASSRNLPIIAFAMFLLNLGRGIGDPAWYSLVAESTRKTEKGKSFSIIYLGGTLAGILGPLALTYLSSFSIPLTSYVTAYGFLIFLTWGLKIPFLVDSHHRKRVSIPRGPERSRMIRTTIVLSLDALIWGVSITIFNGMLVLEFGYSEGELGLFLFLQNLSAALFLYPCGKMIDKIGRKWGLVLGEVSGVISILSALVAIFFADPFLPIVMFHLSLGVSIAFWIPSLLTATTDFEESGAAVSYGLITTLTGFGWTFTGLVGGTIYATVGYVGPFIVTLIFLGPLVYLLLRLPEPVSISLKKDS